LGEVRIAACFLFDGLKLHSRSSPACSHALTLRVRAPQKRLVPRTRPGGLRYVLEQPATLTILTLFAVVGIFGWSYSVLMPAFARDVPRGWGSSYGLLSGVQRESGPWPGR